MTLLLEQFLNGLQLGVTLFVLAAGLTLTFGIMGIINLAHGSLFMVGAFAAALAIAKVGSFWLGLIIGMGAAALTGLIVERLVIDKLYARDHLDQVLATFGLILFFNGFLTWQVGRMPLMVAIPPSLDTTIEVIPGLPYSLYRLFVIAAGLLVALLIWFIITKTRLGMLIRAGATNRDMVRALGVDIRLLFTLVFGLGALLAGLAGIITAPLSAVQVGMGEKILILTFVVVVVGGIGSVKGAFFGALLVGIVDTLMRAFVPMGLRLVLKGPDADALAAGLSSMGIYLLMAIVLTIRPRGLFPAEGTA